ncbi:MAG: DsbA family protein [Gemmobacter sp.]|nr:DsbA family protein [Gemmobacter sp.]
MHRRTLLGALAASTLAASLPHAALAQAAKPEVWEIAIGNPDAKVTLTEYASYTCPHCANFHTAVWKDLKRDYIDTGKVRFIYREVYFDRYGLWAAMVARCGGEMRYFGIQDMLYSQQREWSGAGDPVAIVEALRKIGLTAGLTKEQLDTCLSDGAMAEAMMAKFQQNAEADKIDSTPSLLINGEKHGNMGYAALAKLLDAKLAE